MEHDAKKIREEGPLVFAQVKHDVGVQQIVEHILRAWREAIKPAPTTV